MDEADAGDYWYARIGGQLGVDDALDSVKVLAADVNGGSLDGLYLNVNISAESYGSLLDAKIEIYNGDTLLGEASTNDFDSGADPVLKDLLLTDMDSVYIVLTSEGDQTGTPDEANNYFGMVSVSVDPIF